MNQHNDNHNHSHSHDNHKTEHNQNIHHKPKHKNHFNSALIAVVVLMAIVSIAFMSENSFTGYVVSEEQVQIVQQVPELENFKSLETLSPGNYYVDNEGVVYWLDDESLPAVAKVRNINDDQRSRKIYIDNEGNVGYLLN